MKRTMQDPDVKGLFDNIAERNERNTKAVEELEREYEGDNVGLKETVWV